MVDAGHHPVIQQISCGDSALVSVQLGGGHPAVGINEGLLIDAAHPFDGAHVVCVLGSQVAGVLRLNLLVGFFLLLGLLQRRP